MILRTPHLRLTFTTTTLLTLTLLTLLLLSYNPPHITHSWQAYTTSLPTLALSFCPKHPRPNLILSSIDGDKWADVIYKFMESLEVSLAKEMLHAKRRGECEPEAVDVRIIVPPAVGQDLSPTFEALGARFPHLEFPGALPDGDEPGVLRRFIGWADFLRSIGKDEYGKVMVMDLDIVFQRNPFAIRIPRGADLVFFKEWWGMKLGQQRTHFEWHRGCMGSPGGPDGGAYESEVQFRSYAGKEIICDGTSLGTVEAMRVYLDMMSRDIQKTEFGCNDQAMHQHIYYSGLLEEALSDEGLGSVIAIANEESEVGTIGWVPYVRYNHWGEVLSETGEVQAVVHQFKAHPKLVAIVHNKYSWLADPGLAEVPEMPELVEDEEWTAEKQGEIDELSKGKTEEEVESDLDIPLLFKQYTRLEGVTDRNCTRPEDLCSCWFQGCHVDYGPHIV